MIRNLQAKIFRKKKKSNFRFQSSIKRNNCSEAINRFIEQYIYISSYDSLRQIFRLPMLLNKYGGGKTQKDMEEMFRTQFSN